MVNVKISIIIIIFLPDDLNWWVALSLEKAVYCSAGAFSHVT